MASKARFNAEVRYSAQMQGLIGEVRRASREQVDAIGKVHDAVEKNTGGWARLSTIVTGVRSAYMLASGAMRTVAGVMVDLVEAAAAEESQIRQLDRTLRLHTTSYAAHEQALDGMIDRYKDTTRFGDDAVRSALGAVSQATAGLRLPFAELQRYTRIALDIAEATGRDAAAAGQIVARAATGNIRALRELLPEMARQLRDIGDGSGAAAAAIGTLERQFAGAAVGIGATEQAIAGAQNDWDDFKEFLGGTLVGAIDGAVDGLFELTGGVDRNAVAWADWFAQFTPERMAAAERARALVAMRGAAPYVSEPTGAAQGSSDRLRAWMLSRDNGLQEWIGGGNWGAWATEGGGGESGGGGAGPRRDSASPWGALAGGESAMQAMRDQGLQRLREWADERTVLEQMATDGLRAESDKRVALIQAEIAAETSRKDTVLSTLGELGANAASAMGSIIKGERPLAVWRAAMMAAEVGWQLLVEHNPAGAAKAAGTFALYETAKAIAGAASSGSRGGGSGGSRTAYSGTGNPAQAGALIGRPDSGGRTVAISVTFKDSVVMAESDQMRQHLVRAWNEAERRGEIRR